MDNRFPRTMRTGISNSNFNDEPNLESIYDVGGLLMVFFEDTLKLAQKHAFHANREITHEDLEKGFKVRAIYEDHFWTKSDTISRALNHKQFLKENNNSVSTIPESILENSLPSTPADETWLNSGNTNTTYTNSGCSCRVCSWFETIEEKWETWEPTKHYQIILKRQFENVFE